MFAKARNGRVNVKKLLTAFSKRNIGGCLKDAHGIQVEDAQWEKVIEDADTDRDGELTFDEFEAALISTIDGASVTKGVQTIELM